MAKKLSKKELLAPYHPKALKTPGALLAAYVYDIVDVFTDDPETSQMDKVLEVLLDFGVAVMADSAVREEIDLLANPIFRKRKKEK